jgi:multisubunit Na+/H+ antiporter MnhG subunit
MKPETKAKLEDLKVFFSYTFSLKDLYRTLTARRNVLWGLMIFFAYVMIYSNIKAKYWVSAIILFIFFLVLLVPLYKSGDHRAWARQQSGYSLKHTIKKYKEVKNGNTNLSRNEGMSDSGN